MTFRRLTMSAAALAVGISAVVAPSFPSQAAPLAPEFPSVAAATSSPARLGDAPGALSAPTLAQSRPSTAQPARRRFRIRSRHRGPVDAITTIIAVVIGVVVLAFFLVFRHLRLKAARAQAASTPSFNGPNGPQYGVTAGPGYAPQYPPAGAPTGTPPAQGYAGYQAGASYAPGNGYGEHQPPATPYGSGPLGPSGPA